MTGTTKAILSLSVLLLAALVVYYGMTPEQQSSYISADVPSRTTSIDDAVFGGDPYEKASELGLLTKLSDPKPKPDTRVPVGQENWLPPDKIVDPIEADDVTEVTEVIDAPVEPEFFLYTVKEGETLGEIASREAGGFSKWQAIAEFNSISDPSSIRAGRVLRIPTSSDVAKPVVTVTVENEIVDMVQYVIKEGDTLSSIAEFHYGDANLYRVILDANPTLDARRLKIGNSVMVPKL
ncbi:MAG: hypothetical protein CMJ38_08355 [Phycisphaerae bacterium]|nr:hypothetical protein [Phycisphaerae bacterium]